MMPSFSFLSPALCLIGMVACAKGAVLLTPTHDNNTLRNNGGDDVQPWDATSLSLKEATEDQVNSRTAFLKFDTTTASTAVDGNQATLTLTTSGTAGALFNLQVYALNAGAAGYDWNENTIVWNTSPAVSSSTDTFYVSSLATQIGSFDIANNTAAGTQFNIGFSNWSSFVQSDNSLTLIVVVTNQSAGGPSLTFASSESATSGARPLLAIPEPGTGSLALLASLALVGRRRR